MTNLEEAIKQVEYLDAKYHEKLNYLEAARKNPKLFERLLLGFNCSKRGVYLTFVLKEKSIKTKHHESFKKAMKEVEELVTQDLLESFQSGVKQ